AAGRRDSYSASPSPPATQPSRLPRPNHPSPPRPTRQQRQSPANPEDEQTYQPPHTPDSAPENSGLQLDALDHTSVPSPVPTFLGAAQHVRSVTERTHEAPDRARASPRESGRCARSVGWSLRGRRREHVVHDGRRPLVPVGGPIHDPVIAHRGRPRTADDHDDVT